MLNLPSQVEMLRFDNRDLLMTALTEQISQQLRSGIAESQTASIALSGGRSPIPLFGQLSQQNLDWDKVTATLVDDRWLPETEDDSNGRLVRQHLLQNQAAAANFIGLYQDGVDAYDGQETCNQRLSTLPDQLDCIVLGMGNDGHTASLFPCSDDLATALSSTQNCAAVTPTTAPHARMTLTPHRLLQSKLRILLMTGEDKLATLEQALADTTIETMPIRLFLQQPLTIYWAP